MKADTVADTVASAWRPTRPSPRDPRAAADDKAEALPIGARLDEFEILGLLGSGGFGAVYLARDHALLRNVAVKEYLPVDFARRGRDLEVVARSDAERETFAGGLQSFIREAQLLAGFDHPSLVKVHRFWEANGTAYMVMPHYPGRTLKEVRRELEGSPDEAWLRALLEPMLAALETLHAADVCHRDVSPDNILLQPDGVPVLLDFGCARQLMHDRTQALTAIFKPSFAAIEQYGDDPGLKQGSWTDLYALGGVIRYLITGAPPPPAAMRAVKDSMQPLADIAAADQKLSRSFLQVIDWALQVDPARRPQSVAALRAALGDTPDVGSAPVDPAEADVNAGPSASTTAVAASHHARQAPQPRRKTVRVALAFAIPLTLAAGVWSAAGQIGSDRHAEAAPGRTDAARVPALVGREPGLQAEVAGPAARATASVSPTTPAPAALPLLTREPAVAPRSAAAEPGAAAAEPRRAVEPRRAAADARAAAVEPQPATVDPRAAAAEARKRDVAAVASLASQAAQTKPGSVPSNAAVPPQRPIATAPAHATGAAPASPRQACGDRNFFSMAVCMDRQCRQPQYRSHPECAEFIGYAESRRQSERAR
jgi:serine/threonine protein kinase